MKTLKIISSITLIASIIVFLLTISDFLALHDIFNEYVCANVIKRFIGELPDSASTSMEWKMVNVSYGARFFFLLFNMGVLIYFIKRLRSLKTTPDK
jgi:hypothetical protein